MAPRVLISDQLSPAAIDIFKARGVDVDVKTGLAKDELLKIIGDYDGPYPFFDADGKLID